MGGKEEERMGGQEGKGEMKQVIYWNVDKEKTQSKNKMDW